MYLCQICGQCYDRYETIAVSFHHGLFLPLKLQQAFCHGVSQEDDRRFRDLGNQKEDSTVGLCLHPFP
jgi:hypothetical protein